MRKFKPPTERDYLFGIPARDLSDEEYAALSKEDQKRVDKSGLWSAPPEKKPAEKGVSDAR